MSICFGRALEASQTSRAFVGSCLRFYSKASYISKGYNPIWVDLRMRSIGTRKRLSDVWCAHGISQSSEFSALSNILSYSIFEMTTQELRRFKSLAKEPIRDHMNDMELIFLMMGEEMAEKISVSRDLRGFEELKEGCIVGGTVSKELRLRLERITQTTILKPENFLHLNKALPGSKV